jgi:NAD(P)-dependent dehydrogenase (short-subunit alcohol dehydrogenase family)
LGPDSVVVATGGGRGITAELLMALARAAEAPPTLYLLGRVQPAASSTLPSRRDFLEAERGRRPGTTMAELTAAYDRLQAATETRRTIERLTELCGEGRVHHLRCDVSDRAALVAAVAHVHAAHDRVDLLVNAAGLHFGGSVRATSLENARLVRDTKLLGYLNLRAAFAERPPRRWYNIGSLLAVLGWPGEAPYCSGNELLNTAAGWSRRFGPDDERTLALPLWNEAGFAAEPITRDLLRRQAALTGVSNREGAALFLAELTAGDGAAEITYLGSAERELLSSDRSRDRSTAPLLVQPAGASQYSFVPDIARRDGYLKHHRIQGSPVLPGALVVELAAEASVSRGSEGVLLTVRDVEFHAAIRGEQHPRSGYRVRVSESASASGHDDWLTVGVYSDVTAPDGRVLRKDRLHAQLVLRPGVAPCVAPGPWGPVRPSRGRSVRPPWYEDGALLRLDGPFLSLVEVTAEGALTRARFAPDVGAWADRFRSMRLPVLLLDALIQLAVVARGAATGRVTDMIPEGVARVSFFTAQTDVALLEEHGPIAVTADTEGSAMALAPDGTILLQVQGVRTAGVRQRDDHRRVSGAESP